jgi:hypothetical protein
VYELPEGVEPAPEDGSVTKNMRDFDDDPERTLESKVSLERQLREFAGHLLILSVNQDQLEVRRRGPMCSTPSSQHQRGR